MIKAYFLSNIILFILIFFTAQKGKGQIVLNKPDMVSVYTYRLQGKTATGILTNEIKEHFVAISRDLLDKYPLHSKLILYDCKWQGIYKVMDIMGKQHKKSVDVYYSGKKKRDPKKCRCSTAWK